MYRFFLVTTETVQLQLTIEQQREEIVYSS